MGNALVKAAVIDVGIQLAGWAVASKLETETFYDITGSCTFFILVIKSMLDNGTFFPRQVFQSSMVSVWAVRLGLFLLFRVLKDGKDVRFNRVRGNPKMFLLFWAVQALWVWTTLLPTSLLNSKKKDTALGTRDYVGWALWGTGFLLEMVADYQKYSFKSDPANANKWINHGVWSIVRHPNYLGEIMLWSGLYISASSTFRGWENLSFLSPIFIAYLLAKVSGIPILERRAIRRWKDNAEFMHYMQNSYRLVPFLY